MAEKVIKKKRTIFNIISSIVDILVYPIIFISFFSSFFMIVSKTQGVVKPIFGYTFVKVLSPSMSYYCEEAKRNFEVDDIVVIKTKTAYEVGDIIAFYSYTDPSDNAKQFELTSLETKLNPKRTKDGGYVYKENGELEYVTNSYSPVKNSDGTVIFNEELYQTIKNARIDETFATEHDGVWAKEEISVDRATIKDVTDANCVVKFHQIVQIKIDTTGTIFYVTKGTNNASIDPLVREDLVVGKYVNTPKFMSVVMSFCSSSIGMLILVVIPISIIILIELLSILEQINNIMLERKVVSRAVPFDTKECEKANIGFEMREFDKVYLYDVMPSEYKPDLFVFLWGMLENSDKKNYKKIYDSAVKAKDVFDANNTDEYYETWISCFKSRSMKKKLEEMQKKADDTRYEEVLYDEYQNEEPKYSQKTSKIKNNDTELDFGDVVEQSQQKTVPKAPPKKLPPKNEN